MAKEKRHTLSVHKEEEEKMAEPQKPQTPAGPTSGGTGPTSGGTTPAETPDKPPAADPVPTIEEALASLGAPQVMQSGHDGREKFTAWLEDFAKNNPEAMKTKAEKAKEKEMKDHEKDQKKDHEEKDQKDKTPGKSEEQHPAGQPGTHPPTQPTGVPEQSPAGPAAKK